MKEVQLVFSPPGYKIPLYLVAVGIFLQQANTSPGAETMSTGVTMMEWWK